MLEPRRHQLSDPLLLGVDQVDLHALHVGWHRAALDEPDALVELGLG